MKRKGTSLAGAFFLLFGVFLLLLLLINSEIAMDGVRRGLSLCTETLFPSLFPFLVLSELLVAAGAGQTLGRLFSRPVSALFGLSERGTAAFLLGSLCGFPIGTTTAVALYEKGEIGKQELDRLMLFANNPSSGFLVSAVGEALFGSRSAGIALFVITLLSAILIAAFLRLLCGKLPQPPRNPSDGAKKQLCASDITGSVRRGFSSLLQVMAFVLFFSCVSACLSAVVQDLGLPEEGGVLLCGLLELTAGISRAVTTLSPAAAFRASAFFSGFAGLSVCLQLFSVAEKQNPHLLQYLLSRTAQGCLALLLAQGYLLLFRPDFLTAESVDSTPLASAPQLSIPLLLLGLFLLLAASLVWRKKKKA